MQKAIDRCLGGASVIYVVILLAWLVQQPVPALQDFLEWVFQGWAFLRLAIGDANFAREYAFVSMPVPNMLVQLLISGVSWITGPFVAAKIVVTAYLALGVAVCWRLARRFAPAAPSALFVLLLGVAVFNACFWHGYLNYQVSLLLILLYIELTVATQPSARMVLCFGVLLFCCHASMLAAFLLLVALREWKRPDRLGIFAAMTPSAALLAFYFVRRHGHRVGAQVSHGVATSGLLSHVAYKGYTLAKAGPFHNFVIADGSSLTRWPAIYHLGVGLNFCFAICLLAAVAVSISKMLAGSTSRLDRWIYFGVLALLFLFLPSDIAEVVNLGERFLYLLIVMLMLESAGTRWVRLLAALSVVGFALTILQLPAASLRGVNAPEAFHRPPALEGRAYAADGLFSHRLYQNDERRIEIRDGVRVHEPLLFDTGLLKNRASLNAAPAP